MSVYHSTPQQQRLFSLMAQQQQFHGPCYVDVSTKSRPGDTDPAEECDVPQLALGQLNHSMMRSQQQQQCDSQDLLDQLEWQVRDLSSLVTCTLESHDFEPEEEEIAPKKRTKEVVLPRATEGVQ